MAPITVYTDSPVAAKPSGVTPQTAAEGRSPGTASPATTTASPSAYQKQYPAAQPGATPTLPKPTGAAQAFASPIQPTPTHALDISPPRPPRPQPGAVPRPAASQTSSLPPLSTSAPQSELAPYPQQMTIPPPIMAYPAQQSGTATAFSPVYGSQAPADQCLEHPPGYQQNVTASELDRYQRSVMERSESEYQSDDGVWNTAKKWAQATGEKLAAAEKEIWKKINKD